MVWTEIAIGISVIIFGFYYWLTSTFDYWASRHVAEPSPKPFFGNLFNVYFGKLSFTEYLKTIYDANRNKAMVGIFMRCEPTLVLIDPDLIKDVLIKDFSAFPERGIKTFPRAEPLSQHLFNLEPALWRPLRNKLSPVFSSGKLKNMFHLLLKCGRHLEEYLAKLTLKNEPVECCELADKFTTDVIGICVFGLQVNALVDETNEFRKMSEDILTPNWKKIIKIYILHFAPWLYSLLGPVITDCKTTNFFLTLMRDTVDYRKKNKILKHDFMDLIMELRDNPDKLGDIEITDSLLTAQLFAFFVAGFETSSVTISNALYELAQNQTIQNKLRDSINKELTKNNGELTYEGIKSMTYLNMVFQETLRKYPPGTVFMRKSAKQYTFAGTKLTIPKGAKIIVPVFAIHRDPRIYPNPEVFDPERFTDEAIKARHPMSWLAFGDGPRNCIGARFANYQTKVGLIKILQQYKVEVCDKTRIPYVIDPKSFILSPIDGTYLKISKVD